jgi:hypothetical protein
MKKSIIAGLTICMALALFGCDGMLSESSKGDGFFSDGGSNSGNSTSGVLTITGITSSQYGSYRIYINSSSSESTYTSNYSARSDVTSISASTKAIDLIDRSSGSRWSSTGSYYVFIVNSSSGSLAAKGSSSIAFKNGSASVTASSLWSSGTDTFPPPSSTQLPGSGIFLSESLTAGPAKWYRFTATSSSTYYVEWRDYDNAGPSYCNIKTSVYESNSTPIQVDVDGYGSIYVSGKTGTIYVKVQGVSTSTSGNFEIGYW